MIFSISKREESPARACPNTSLEERQSSYPYPYLLLHSFIHPSTLLAYLLFLLLAISNR